MKSKICIIGLFLLFALAISADNLEIVSFGYIEGTPALKSKERVKDENGNDCALIKVQTLEQSMQFYGDIVGIPENKINEYWVYIKPTAKSITISAPDEANKIVVFADYQTEPLQANLQYAMIIKVPQKRQIIISEDVTIEELTSNAEKGNAESALELGKRYMAGTGVTQDPNVAKVWFASAAEKGNAEAQYRLGRCYALGQGVADKNYRTAVKYYQLSADQGFAEAIYALGVCYEKGQGVEANLEKAKELYQKAAKLGNKNAVKKINSFN